jgi:proteic killer suppression protein
VNIATVARRKLRQLEIAEKLDDLRVPPGNRLESLKGDRAGQQSNRVNDHFACVFVGPMQALKTLKSWTITDGGKR